MRSLYKNKAQLKKLLEASHVTACALDAVEKAIQPGISALELDEIATKTILELGGKPNFALVPGYKHTICASNNDVIVHGIPNANPLQPGDILSIDCGAVVDGWNGDSARTFVLDDPKRPDLVRQNQKLSDHTKRAMWCGIAAFAQAKYVNEIGVAIERSIRTNPEYGMVTNYTGHGIGKQLHEAPTIYNHSVPGRSARVKPGLVIAIEPMVTGSVTGELVADDEWSVLTEDGSCAAHWEHTVAIHDKGIWVLTAHDGGAKELAEFGIQPVALS